MIPRTPSLLFLLSALLFPALVSGGPEKSAPAPSGYPFEMKGKNGTLHWKSADRTDVAWVETRDHIDEGKGLLCRNPRTNKPHKEFLRSSPVPFSPGAEYRISGYLRTDRPGLLFLTPYGASSAKTIRTSGKWQKISLEFKAAGKDGTRTFFLILSTPNGKEESSIQELTVKDFSITRKE